MEASSPASQAVPSKDAGTGHAPWFSPRRLKATVSPKPQGNEDQGTTSTPLSCLGHPALGLA